MLGIGRKLKGWPRRGSLSCRGGEEIFFTSDSFSRDSWNFPVFFSLLRSLESTLITIVITRRTVGKIDRVALTATRNFN